MAEHPILLAQVPAPPAPPVVIDATPGQVIDLSGAGVRDTTLTIEAGDLVVTRPDAPPIVVRDLVDAATMDSPPVVQLAEGAMSAPELVGRVLPFDAVRADTLLPPLSAQIGPDFPLLAAAHPATDFTPAPVTVATANDDPFSVRIDPRSGFRPISESAAAAVEPSPPSAPVVSPASDIAATEETAPLAPLPSPAAPSGAVVGSAGDDTVALSAPVSGGTIDLGGGTDRLALADGNNVLAVRNVETITGGSGDDRVAIDAAAAAVDLDGGLDTLDLSAIASADLGSPAADYDGIEKIDLRGGGANSLTLSAADVLDLSPTTDTLLVRGDAADVVAVGNGWAAAGSQTNPQGETGTFSVYTQTVGGVTATLLVENSVAVT